MATLVAGPRRQRVPGGRAGDIIREVAESGDLGTVVDKRENPAAGSTAAKPNDETEASSAAAAKKKKKKKGGGGGGGDEPATKPLALDPQTQADRRAERFIVSALRREFGDVIAIVGEEASEGALAGAGAVEADGTVDAEDEARATPEEVARAARGGVHAVAPWEVLVPFGTEVGPKTADAYCAEAEDILEARRQKKTLEVAGPPEAGPEGGPPEGPEAPGADPSGNPGSSHPSEQPEDSPPSPPPPPPIVPGRHAACSRAGVTVWVDPLDGTREFVEGPEFWQNVTCLIGIAVGGVPVAGVIHQPFVGPTGEPIVTYADLFPEPDPNAPPKPYRPRWRRLRSPTPPPKLNVTFGPGRTFFGAVGMGVFARPGKEPLEAYPIPAPRKIDFKNIRVCTSRSHANPIVEGAVYRLSPVPPLEPVVFRVGGAGGKVAMLLDGVADAWVFPARGTKRWDTCAGEALLSANRNGFLVAAMTGAAYDYGDEVSKRWPGNIDGVIACADRDAYEWMVKKWPWLNDAGGERKGPRDAGRD